LHHADYGKGELMRILFVLLGVGALALGVIAYWMYRGEHVARTYESYSEALEAGMVERGWIPPWVPASAVSIDLAYDLDTNFTTIGFRAPKDDLELMAATLVSASLSERETLRAESYFRSMSARMRVQRESIDFFRDTSDLLGARCVAVHWDRLTAFAWSCR
jgi:hypothetical protein